jgi:hypothetical protein
MIDIQYLRAGGGGRAAPPPPAPDPLFCLISPVRIRAVGESFFLS